MYIYIYIYIYTYDIYIYIYMYYAGPPAGPRRLLRTTTLKIVIVYIDTHKKSKYTK